MAAQEEMFPSPLIMDGACFRRDQSLAVGIAKDRVTQDVHLGLVRQVLRGVYVDSRRPDDLLLRASALSLVLPTGAAVARRSAAWLRGFETRPPRDWARVPDVECVLPPGLAPIKRIGVRAFVAPLRGDIEVLQGIPTTTPVRTAVDLLRWLPPHLGLGAVDQMARARMFSVPELRQAIEDWRGARNVAIARRLASYCDPGAESPGESWTRLRLLDAGFPRPEVQVPLEVAGRVVYRLDMGYPDRMLAVEYDGLEFHTGRDLMRHDEQRRARIHDEFGWTVVPVGRGEILGRSMAFEHALGELLGMEPAIRTRRW